MNPYQQPQNNGYPQQAGPNKYPTLPPIQNPQYPAQQPQYPGAGYQPPAQYGNIQAESSQNKERQAISMKIADLDQGFNTCFMNFYKVWLWLLAAVCTVAFVGYFINYLIEGHIYNNAEYAADSFLLMAWNGFQGFFGLKAISEKNLKKANVACVMICISLIPWLVLDIIMLYAVMTVDRNGSWNFFNLMVFLLVLFTLVCLVHIGLSMNGAFKVRKLLIERGLLQEKLDNMDYTFKA